jgi:hypothetical protein
MEIERDGQIMGRVKRVISAGFTIATLLFAVACDEDPTSVGEGILPDEDIILVDTLIIHQPTETFSFPFALTTGGLNFIYSGENAEVRVESIFRFDVLLSDMGVTADSIAAVIENHDGIFNASLILTPVVFEGDSAESLEFELFEPRNAWLASGFNRDIFESIGRSSEPVASGAMVLGDTAAVEIDLPAELISRWAELSEQTVFPRGLIITSPPDSRGIVAFEGRSVEETGPRLRIIIGSADEPDTLTFSQTIRGYAAFPKYEIDITNNIVLQAGTATRSVLKFDLSSLPAGAFIHNARLEMVRNEDLTVTGQFSADSLEVNEVVDPDKRTFSNRFQQFFTKSADTAAHTVTYSASVTNIIQAWSTGVENRGFLIRDANETAGFHRTSFHTETAAEPGRRPRLTIIYSAF